MPQRRGYLPDRLRVIPRVRYASDAGAVAPDEAPRWRRRMRVTWMISLASGFATKVEPDGCWLWLPCKGIREVMESPAGDTTPAISATECRRLPGWQRNY